MRHLIATLVIAIISVFGASAQITQAIVGGNCGTDCQWSFNGYTLSIRNTNKKGMDVEINNYNTSNNIAPWLKKRLNVRKIEIGEGISRIGSCAFANLPDLQEVVFNDAQLNCIGWGAFLNCRRLRTISLPVNLRTIETIAFANCDALASIRIPDQCRVGDQAFASCENLKSIELSPTTILGHYVFAGETQVNGKPRHTLYNHDVRRIPAYINEQNANEYGIAPAAVEKLVGNNATSIDYDYETSEIDKMIPTGAFMRNNTYALVIGNQNYRFVSDVPYAIHDARVFADYCRKTLGIPVENIHVTEDATKQMILEEELQDWLAKIPNPEYKKLIVYYAGHGVPDVKDSNKAYLLPTDVRGTNPSRGIALEDFYKQIGDLAFNQTTVFLDACFSGVNRENEGVTEGLRGVEIDAENAELGGGNVVVFSAAQGNETAQGYPEEGHGLFTYYLLKEIRDSNGETTLGNLSDVVKENVSLKAPQMKLRKKQTPTTNASDELAEKWRRLHM